MAPGITFAPAAADERLAALRLTFGHLDPETRLARVAGALELIDRGELDPSGILVARAGDTVVGAMVVAPVPGAGAAVWPPQVEPGPGSEIPAADVAAIADELVRGSVEWLRGRGVKLAQALLAPEDAALAEPLLRNGFHRATALWYLRHDLELSTTLLGEPERLTYATFASIGPEPFAAVLAHTYEGTQDCPEISDARTAQEALAGHQAEGFDPDRWWLAAVGGAPAGLLLVNPAPDGDGWEIAYVGVVPALRRRGYGRELVLKALVEAKAAGEPRVSLAVDARNRPARELYRGIGFEPTESREVLLAVWR